MKLIPTLLPGRAHARTNRNRNRFPGWSHPPTSDILMYIISLSIYIGGWGGETVQVPPTGKSASFRSCVRARGLVVRWKWRSTTVAHVFPFPFCTAQAFPFPLRFHPPPPQPPIQLQLALSVNLYYIRIGEGSGEGRNRAGLDFIGGWRMTGSAQTWSEAVRL